MLVFFNFGRDLLEVRYFGLNEIQHSICVNLEVTEWCLPLGTVRCSDEIEVLLVGWA